MKSLVILCLVAGLFGFTGSRITEKSPNAVVEVKSDCEVTYSLYAPADYVTPEFEEELHKLSSQEEIAAFFKWHNAEAAKLMAAAPSDEVLLRSGCGSWVFVDIVGVCFSPFSLKLLEKRECWAGITSNGTKYGLWTEWRYSC